ncbi:MAG: response regulator [bacterium]|nr:response regulator [bacterium]
MAQTILIIENDAFWSDVLVKKLGEAGYNTALVTDGAMGFQKLKESHPDIVLLDIMLPTMNGYEILEAKQKDPTLSVIPVIIISNSGQSEEINRALSLGVKDYLVKTQFDPEEVVTKVRIQLGQDGKTATLSGGPALSPNHTTIFGKKIMWVEDDKFLSDIISRKLSTEKCTLLHFKDGREALAELKKNIPDIIILDILLSGIDGWEILKKIKEDPSTKNIPVILLSNLGQKGDVDKGKEYGANRFLVKATVTLDEIIEEIGKVLNTA